MKHTSRLDIPQHKLVRSLVDYELIGRKWKRSDALSRPILIDRGLELAVSYIFFIRFLMNGNEHSRLTAHTVGDYDAEGPPVPIPNTVVKLCGA